MLQRDVAQFGSAHVWGAWSRKFKSCHPDQRRTLKRVSFFFWKSKGKSLKMQAECGLLKALQKCNIISSIHFKQENRAKKSLQFGRFWSLARRFCPTYTHISSDCHIRQSDFFYL